VVILESTNAGRYIQTDLRTIFGRQTRTLAYMIENVAPLLPEVTAARKAGF